MFEDAVSAPTPWLRYVYSNFDFSSIKDPGLYVIEYAGQRSDVFPIAQNVYDNTWQTTLDGFLAVQMDHVSVRDGYHEWHGVAHMDDARQAPPNTPHFDGYRMGPDTYSPYKPGEHVPGLNVGGWFDAGDYDNDDYGQYATIQNLSLAYSTFHIKYDELTVDQKARSVEMHRPDGIPDIVQQVEHGVLQQLAQVHAFGHPIVGIQSAWLTQYTFVGDAASQSDNLLYDPKLSPDERMGGFSGNLDDRWAWTGYTAYNQYGAATSLAAASSVLKGWNDPLAKQCLDTAVKLWNDEKTHPAPNPFRGGFAGRFGSPDWSAALELMIATNGADPYKQRVQELFPEMLKHMGFRGWTAVRALPYLDAELQNPIQIRASGVAAAVRSPTGSNPLWRASRARRLGRLRAGRGLRRRDVFPSRSVSRCRRPGIYAARGQLSARHPPGLERILHCRHWHRVAEANLLQQSRRLFLHSRRHDPRLRRHQAGLPGVHQRFRNALV